MALLPAGSPGWPGSLELRAVSVPGRLMIDQSPCRASLGFRGVADLGRENAALGRQAIMDWISRSAQAGDELARIEESVDPAVAAGERALAATPVEVVLTSLDPPVIRYEPGGVQTEWVLVTGADATGRILDQVI
ncbi:MAG: DUF6470 family protein [Heliobacteriaceae bacterium]|nr:DUF6470 family protein [Heliobacteriaceae bacterium]